jgi:beta-RFAP synthase
MSFVQTASRLHFGLLSLAAAPGRRFGSVGLMVQQPGVAVRCEPAAAWSAEGPLAERALAYARRFLDALRAEGETTQGPPLRLRLERAALEHVGLGTGTQLGLAVARAVASAWGMSCAVPDLARRVGRGRRSALGIHGFEQGGFLVEAGKEREGALAPLVARLPFPAAWRVVLAVPESDLGLHGVREEQAFTHLAGHAPPGHADALCRLVLLGLLPALAEADLQAFGPALYEFNVRVGVVFAPIQGDVYASPAVRAVVEFVRGRGVSGAGQSSWGPAVFAVTAGEDHARNLARALRERFALQEGRVWVTAPSNEGAREELEQP